MSVQFLAVFYVCRSGSTLFSRLLSDQSSKICVLPEVKFPLRLLVEKGRGKVYRAAELFKIVKSDPRFDSLQVTDERLGKICDSNNSGDLQNLMLDLGADADYPPPSIVAFKHESLIYFHEELAKSFTNLMFIHVVRDPRAVVNSMLHSPIPEKPGFDMARGSAVYAARHWRNYMRLARVVGAQHNLLTVRFEDISGGGHDAFRDIFSRLELGADTNITPKNSRRAYHISNIDRAIHSNVFENFKETRIDAWLNELSKSDISIVESICWDELCAAGYQPSLPRQGRFSRLMIAAMLRHWILSLSHYVRTVAAYTRRPGGVVELIGRIRLARIEASQNIRAKISAKILSRVATLATWGQAADGAH